MGQKKLKTCSLVTWAATRAMVWAALVLGPLMNHRIYFYNTYLFRDTNVTVMFFINLVKFKNI